MLRYPETTPTERLNARRRWEQEATEEQLATDKQFQTLQQARRRHLENDRYKLFSTRFTDGRDR